MHGGGQSTEAVKAPPWPLRRDGAATSDGFCQDQGRVALDVSGYKGWHLDTVAGGCPKPGDLGAQPRSVVGITNTEHHGPVRVIMNDAKHPW